MISICMFFRFASLRLTHPYTSVSKKVTKISCFFISQFRRRPLYKPTSSFGRFYIRVRNFTLGILTISVVTFGVFYILDARSAIHRYIFTPALRLITPDPEDAHRIAVLALKYGLHPK